MAQLYRLEFNEQQQKFHLDNHSHEENDEVKSFMSNLTEYKLNISKI